MGGSAISKTMNVWSVILFLVQGAKELAEIKAFFHGLQYASNGRLSYSKGLYREEGMQLTMTVRTHQNM